MEETATTPKKRKHTVKSAKKTDAKIKKEIAKAVDNIPSLLAKESREKEKKAAPTDPQKVLKQKRQLLWLGVGTMTLVIFGMWMWNIQTTFFDITHKQSAEGRLIQNARQDIQQALAGGSDDMQKKATFEQKKLTTEVKDILRNVLNAAAASSPSSTTISPTNETHGL